MVDTRQAISDLDTAFNEMRDTVRGLSDIDFDRKWLDGRWGVHEIVAFHTYWFGKLSGGLERLSRGEKPTEAQMKWDEIEDADIVIMDHVRG